MGSDTAERADEAEPVGRLDESYVAATSSALERRPRTLKQGDTFAVFDRYGDILPQTESYDGLYHCDTRFLSDLRLRFNGRRPLLLGSTVRDDNDVLVVELTNPDFIDDDELKLARETVHISRSKFLWRGACFERIGVRNFDSLEHTIRLTVLFDADFADIFEIRGHKRPRRGERETSVDGSLVRFRYLGLDQVERLTVIRFDPVPARLTERAAIFDLRLGRGERRSVFAAISCAEQREERPVALFLTGYKAARAALRRSASRTAAVRTSTPILNEVLGRSAADLYMLTTETEQGPVPYAGIPWYSTAFGRDAAITALEMLWFDARIAKGVLKFLAATQARVEDPTADAEPGKIMHETRRGEMARLGEIPFGLYYGSVDSTPLFVLLAGMYLERTGDLDTAAALWPHVEAALQWLDHHGDCDGDGFVEYRRRSERGLENQGWKDSHDSVFHADGRLAQAPIALCEVQAYVYAAKRHAARLAERLGRAACAAALDQQASELQRRFEEAFWCEELGTYALALDRDKNLCRVRTSNAGHVLFAGLADPARAARVADQMMGKAFVCGWGIRTVASSEARYNPMSYHNGSVWPHDNALIALGMSRYGLTDHAMRLFEAFFATATYMELRRLPELFCGFIRKRGKGPTLYPVACWPQAWASAAPIALLQAAVGLSFDPVSCGVRFRRPRLPEFLDEVVIRGLAVGTNRRDILLRRYGTDVSVNVLAGTGECEVSVAL
jgi:glycogen debranching enzyme